MDGKITKYIIVLLMCMPFLGHAQELDIIADTLIIERPDGAITTTTGGEIMVDSLERVVTPGTPVTPGAPVDTLSAATRPVGRKPFLDDILKGNSVDSLVYNVRDKQVFIFEKGDVNYQNRQLKADYMRVDMATKDIYAHGREDTVAGKPTRPEFIDDGKSFMMDTITYNLDSQKARIKGVSTQDGEGILLGEKVKKMPDNTINIAHGRFTTCPADHPHFYLAMTKAKAIPNNKVVIGPSYLVMEDVPLPFIGLPFGFFPMASEKSSGFIMPEFGEEAMKGFYLRNGGYYFTFDDYADLALTAGIYTYGSWEGQAMSRYVKRYKFSGSFDVRFTKDIMGEKGSPDYTNMNNFRVGWSHQQDPKNNPNSTFSASVNFSTSGYSKYGAQTMNDYLNTQTNSSIAYSKQWAGKPFSISTNLQHSQNSRDTTVSLSFPNVVFNLSRVYPFRRRDAVGKQKWYEKIALSYTGTLQNTVTVKERDLFTDNMFSQMRNGMNHVIPVSTSLGLLKNVINITPSFNYQERWYLQKVNQAWDPTAKAIAYDTVGGFYRVWDYRFSIGATTKIYGIANYKKGSLIQGIRHVITPTLGFNYTPDFSRAGYGYYENVQYNEAGDMRQYSPFSGNLYGVPGSQEAASMSFSIQQTLAAKIRSNNEKDTSGFRKIDIIDNFSISSSYNFIAEQFKLAPFSMNLRTKLIKSLALNLTATLDPYQLDAEGRRIDVLMFKKGKPGRITNVSTSFGYSFNSSNNPGGAVNDINSQGALINQGQYMDQYGQMINAEVDPNTRRQLMTSQYYDFSIPWNLGFNYSFSYSKPGLKSNITQTLGFNGSVTLTEKWGLAFNGGYDFTAKKVTPGMVSLTRDLHCWQMYFSWVPIGFRKSWSFSISVKSAMLKDLKYDKNSSFYDNLYD